MSNQPHCTCHGIYEIDCPNRKSLVLKPASKAISSLNDSLRSLNTNLRRAAEPAPLSKQALLQKLAETNTKIQFLRYPDGTLRLFKVGSILGEEPAGYSDEKAVVKGRVTRPNEDFAVILPVTRTMLDKPGAEDRLAELAYSWRG